MEPDTRTEIIRHGDSGEPLETNSVGAAEACQVGINSNKGEKENSKVNNLLSCHSVGNEQQQWHLIH